MRSRSRRRQRNRRDGDPMSVYDNVKSILDVYGYPVESDEYGGGEERYFIVMIDARPTDFANNAPRHERSSVMVHFVAPKSDDISTKEKQIKYALFSAGFTYPSVISAGDSKKWHKIFEFEIVEVI